MVKPEGPGKKTDLVRFRVPSPLKQDFMARMRDEGRVASDVFRAFMEDYLTRPAQRRTQPLETAMTAIRRRPAPAFAAVLGAAGISAVLSSMTPAAATPDLRAAFARMDADGDGVVTLEELAGGGDDNAVTDYGQRRGPSGERPNRSEITGPILLPFTDEAGERRVMILQALENEGTADGRAPESLLAEFAAGDADGDGALSLDEFIERMRRIRDLSFAALDADGDGAISEAEMLAAPDPYVVRDALLGIDANGDGRVTRAEYESAV